jgi:uncharacterized membrane protein
VDIESFLNEFLWPAIGFSLMLANVVMISFIVVVMTSYPLLWMLGVAP